MLLSTGVMNQAVTMPTPILASPEDALKEPTMRNTHDELRDELMVMIAASKELPDDTYELLVEAFLTKLEAGKPVQDHPKRLAARYRDLDPMNVAIVAAIAAAQGLILWMFGEYTLHTVMDLPTNDSVYVPAWMTIGVLWVAEVILTTVVIAILAKTTERRGKSRVGPKKTIGA